MKIIKNKKNGLTSHHKNFKEVAFWYNWNHRNSYNAFKKSGEYNGYTVEDMTLNLSIPIQEILIWMDKKTTRKQNDFNPEIEDNQEVNFDIHSDDTFTALTYTIVCEVENRVSMSDVAHDATGHELQHNDGEVNILSIVRIFDTEGNIIPVDAETEKLIIEKLEL